MKVKTIKAEEFGDILTGEAKVKLLMADDGSYIVGRYLPAGMDIAPSFYWRLNETTGAEMFDNVCKYVSSLGFERAA